MNSSLWSMPMHMQMAVTTLAFRSESACWCSHLEMRQFMLLSETDLYILISKKAFTRIVAETRA